MRIALLTLGMAEKNDSVCNDVAWQYHFLKSRNEFINELRIFAENYERSSFPDIPVENISEFKTWLHDDPTVLVIFHYCDGLTSCDDFLRKQCRNLVIRWHNATPPWFTFGMQNQNALHALHGYQNIIDYIDHKSITFWPNSEFTKDQLIALGALPERCKIVYPASRYLDQVVKIPFQRKILSHDEPIKLLFVSRVVAHKGHINLVALADYVKQITNKPVQLHLAGKGLDDFNDFSRKLRSAIKQADAEVIVHGLVSDEGLIKLYKTSDVFVCLSEHEGFGLPVYEAMCYQLPVVVWANTSFRYLLKDHPLSFENFDINLFSSAIISLLNNDVRNRVIEIQQSISSFYNEVILQDQINIALNKKNNKEKDKKHNYIYNILNENRKKLLKNNSTSYVKDILFDSFSNLTSLYDLKLYNNYLKNEEKLIKLLTTKIQTPSVTFTPYEFSLRKGVIAYDEITENKEPDIINITAQHLIFGPYAQMPVGNYKGTLIAKICNSTNQKITFELDVNIGGRQSGRRLITVEPGLMSFKESIFFKITKEDDLVELRLQPKIDFTGYIIFFGAEITKKELCNLKLSCLQKNLDTIRFSYHSLKTKLCRRIINLRHVSRFPRHCYAYFLFRKARKEAQKKHWSSAIKHYEKGLFFFPSYCRAIVQVAHLYKETGNLDEALSYYLQALNLEPGNADICLQIGHFYKISNDINKAKLFYKRALSLCGPVAIDAAFELKQLNQIQDKEI